MNLKHQDYISSKINKPKIIDDIFLEKCTLYFIKPRTFENQMICWEQDMCTRSIPLECSKLRQFIEYLKLVCSVAFGLLTIKQSKLKTWFILMPKPQRSCFSPHSPYDPPWPPPTNSSLSHVSILAISLRLAYLDSTSFLNFLSYVRYSCSLCHITDISGFSNHIELMTVPP